MRKVLIALALVGVTVLGGCSSCTKPAPEGCNKCEYESITYCQECSKHWIALPGTDEL